MTFLNTMEDAVGWTAAVMSTVAGAPQLYSVRKLGNTKDLNENPIVVPDQFAFVDLLRVPIGQCYFDRGVCCGQLPCAYFACDLA